MSSIETVASIPLPLRGRGKTASAAPCSGGPALQRITPVSSAGHGIPRWARRLSGPLLLVAAWHLASITGVLPGEVLAGPSTVLSSAAKLIATGELQEAMLVSLRRALTGLAIGGSIGITLAIVAGLFRLGEDLVDAPMQMMRTVPNVALIPLLIIWFGIGEAPKIALIALGTAFPLYLNVYAGIRNVDSTLVEAGRTLGLSRAAMIRHVVLPGALPSALVGLRYSLGIAWLALVFGEQINATAGIGYLMANAREFFQTDVIVVCLVVYAFLGLAVDFTVRTLERIFLAWRPAFSGA
ncbi:ABC transporter permease subunit [Mesorhizobium sp. CGMCC 1.15528]|uniref:ABC transporter permease subunit n=1 Tax=Mesorhizobium zhangyense TaxID=1776730 RepID=A0A7C9VFE9_9HYPH|nr:ABC transporter permease subunit [Mesorhizobium zhangyense]NGN44807.1 ABC transporter permease subunit [Mesorhizobium zhangyense]